MPDLTQALPQLDLRQFEGGDAERAQFLQALRDAARRFGFFYVVGHDVPPLVNSDLMTAARAFFALPQAEKDAIAMVHSPHFRGYNRAGLEYTRGKQDWREQLDIGAESTPVPRGPDVPAFARLQGPNQWPQALPDFKAKVLDWQDRVTAVLLKLLRAFAVALGQDEHVFQPIYEGSPHKLLKLIRYPGRDSDAEGQGVGAHKDSGLLSLILQDGAGGLQVELSPDRWIEAAPLDGAFVVNIGELLELASDGYLRATVHRVVQPPPGTERYSAAYFLGARLDATVPALVLPPSLAAEAPGFDRDPQNPLFHHVGENTLKSRLRSHPDVAQRHHADLLTPAH